MSVTDKSNQYFQLASRFVNQTNRHIFLTGKAGTGKTTFLKHIREQSNKKMAVVAPTGVAAINAGGVTLHSFFQLPFGPFLPRYQEGWNGHGNHNTPNTLFKNLRVSNAKKELMRELELLVIDEVSMLRADLVDEIDIILRHFRRQPLIPFGGVQVLFIGDLFQLPPVINNDEWNLLKEYYKSPFFFDAQVLRQNPPLYLELKKIYRQHDEEFISILNNIRNNHSTEKDLERLHQHYLPGFDQTDGEKYITLTTHNSKADTINQNKLMQLPGNLYEFKGEISVEFNEKVLPVDMILQLKTGAQVMFIKNDKGESRRYYNGKIAIVSRIIYDKIYVKFPGEENELELEKEVWKNIRYNYNKEKDKIEEEELGSYTQYPIRLSWAITIHKSQGLTFDKAIIDAGASFAAGQVYVALSRLTSLEGLVLYSRIHPGCINTDERVLEFTRLEKSEDLLQQELVEEQKMFISQSLLLTFNWTKITGHIREHLEQYDHRQVPEKNARVEWASNLLGGTLQQEEMAVKFRKQLEQLLSTATEDNYQRLHERISAANAYFSKSLDETIIGIQQHIKEVGAGKKVRKYQKTLQELIILPQQKKLQLQHAVLITEGLMKGQNVFDLLDQVEEEKKSILLNIKEDEAPVAAKPEKGETFRISLKLFEEGNNITAIAKLRGLAISTVESHLAKFVGTGEIDISKIVPKQKIESILKLIDTTENPTPGTIRYKSGNSYSYGEIRAVMNYKERMEKC